MAFPFSIHEQYRFRNLLPVLAFARDSHLFLLDDNSLALGFECQPLYGGISDSLCNQVKNLLDQKYPTGTFLQFLLYRSPDIEVYIERLVRRREQARVAPFLEQDLAEQVAYLRRHTQQRRLIQNERGVFDTGYFNDQKLWVTCKVPILEAHPSEEEIKATALLSQRLFAQLRALNLNPLRWTAQDWLQRMNTLLHWQPTAGWRQNPVTWDSGRCLRDQLLDYDVSVTVSGRGLTLGEQAVRVLSVKEFPSSMRFGDALRYLSDPYGGEPPLKERYLVAVTVFFPNPMKLESTLGKHQKWAVQQAYGPLLKFEPWLADRLHSHELFYQSLHQGGGTPLQLSLSLLLFCDNDHEADTAAHRAISAWSGFGAKLLDDTFMGAPIFLHNLPFGPDRDAWKLLGRYATMTSVEVPVVLPLHGDWKGMERDPLLTLVSRTGQVIALSFDECQNKNGVIIAPAGSGKSFLSNRMVLCYLGIGAKVFIIDVGGSYKDLCEQLGGQFLQFSEEQKLNLNPFARLVQEQWQQEQAAITDLFCTMASPSGKMKEDDFQKSALNEIICEGWQEQGQKLTVDWIASQCKAHEDQRVKDIGVQLHKFTAQGVYGQYFQGNQILDTSHDLTVLELGELGDHPHLRQIVLLQLVAAVQQEVYLGDRERPVLVLIDEAWELIREGDVSVFIEHAFRKFRKHNAGIIIDTQDVNDQYDSPAGRAIANNSSHMFLLSHKEEAIEDLRASGRLKLSDYWYEQLKSLHTEPGVYSEILVKTDNGHLGVARLMVSAFEHLLYSTRPVDITAVQAYRNQGLSLVDAIHAVLRDREGDES